MKRHDSLAILSRQHHGALILAQLLKKGAPAYKGMPNDTEGKITYASQFYETELLPHFAAEEKVFDTIKGISPELDNAIIEIEEEHALLRKLFGEINEPQAEATQYMDVVGNTLDQHIRKEERQLFPLIESTAGEDKMQEILKLLTH